ncbi:MAG: formate--phosphoribosylaminoimidazolecarboxamide ligase [Nitrososphaerales archaeon]
MKISTLGSHCALQLLKSAKDEGFHTLLLSDRKRKGFYGRFKFIDEIIVVDKFEDIAREEIQDKFKDSILIPHGTLIAQVPLDKVERDLKIPIFGNKYLLRWEADRTLKEKLLLEAKLKVPKRFSSPDEIDSLVIVKLPGAEGGRGYFLAYNKESFERNLKNLIKRGIIKKEEEDKLYIQEYVLGTPVFLHYFYSPLKDELELISIDRRYETIVDSIGRIPATYQKNLDYPSYLVIGNFPLVLRESLLPEVYSMGEEFVKASKRLVGKGAIGPFCLEGVYNEKGEFICFEFSGRIVAGTNLFIDGSPYTWLNYDEPMSMGKRIAREIRRAIELKELDKILT